MQDGAKARYGGMYLCTDGFTPADVLRLAQYLRTQYNLEVTTPKAPGGKGALRIYVLRSSMETVRQLVLPHMHPSMLYKLSLTS